MYVASGLMSRVEWVLKFDALLPGRRQAMRQEGLRWDGRYM